MKTDSSFHWTLSPSRATGFVKAQHVATTEKAGQRIHTEYLHFKVPERSTSAPGNRFSTRNSTANATSACS